MIRTIVLILLFFGSCILLFWNPFWSVTTEEAPTIRSKNLPDFTALDMTLRQYDEQGFLSASVNAEKMEHYRDATTTFIKPSYIIYPKQGDARWKIDAEIGIFDQEHRVLLKNNVTISALDPEEKIREIKIAYLELNLSTMLIDSDALVEIAGKQFLITGQGLKADFNQQYFELLKDIQAVYENNQS